MRQRRRHLGVPVVEEVAHRQGGMLAVDPHPVARRPGVRPTAPPRSRRRDPARARRPVRSRLPPCRSSSAARRNGRCRDCRTAGRSRRPAARRGCRCSPGTPCPRSRCHRCWCVGRAGRIRIEPQRLIDTRGEQHQQVPHSGGEIDSISARRIGFDGLCGFVRAGSRGTTTPECSVAGRQSPPDNAASAIENGNHASGFFGSLTVPCFGRCYKS